MGAVYASTEKEALVSVEGYVCERDDLNNFIQILAIGAFVFIFIIWRRFTFVILREQRNFIYDSLR